MATEHTLAGGRQVAGRVARRARSAVAFDAAGRLVVAGLDGSDDIGGANGTTFVARFAAGGTPDGTFGTGGVADWSDAGGDSVFPSGVRVDGSGRVDVVGLYDYGTVAALRLTAAGAADGSFGRGGLALATGTEGNYLGTGLAVAVTAAGDLLATGGNAAGQGLVVAFSPAATRSVAPADRLYAEQDADDNVTSLSNSTGSVVERYAYGPYGAVTVENPDGTTRGTGAASASYYGSAYLYQGMRLDVVTGTYDGKNRVYDVDLERWLQPDPAGYVDGPDTYQDELSSPADGTDPTGLAFVPSSGAASDELNPFTGGGPSADPGETAAVLGDPAVNGFGTSGDRTPAAMTGPAVTSPAGGPGNTSAYVGLALELALVEESEANELVMTGVGGGPPIRTPIDDTPASPDPALLGALTLQDPRPKLYYPPPPPIPTMDDGPSMGDLVNPVLALGTVALMGGPENPAADLAGATVLDGGVDLLGEGGVAYVIDAADSGALNSSSDLLGNLDRDFVKNYASQLQKTTNATCEVIAEQKFNQLGNPVFGRYFPDINHIELYEGATDATYIHELIHAEDFQALSPANQANALNNMAGWRTGFEYSAEQQMFEKGWR